MGHLCRTSVLDPDTTHVNKRTANATEYTSLTQAACDHMRDLEHETGLELLRITGGLHLAPSDSAGRAEDDSSLDTPTDTVQE